MKDELLEIYKNAERHENTIKEKVIIEYVRSPFCEILGQSNSTYRVEFSDNGVPLYKEEIPINHWVRPNIHYFIDGTVKVFKDDELMIVNDFDAVDKRVYVTLESKALGDTLAWIPYVEEFRLKHSCEMICSTFWNDLFTHRYVVNKYPDIQFVEPGTEKDKIYALYNIGVYPGDLTKNKQDYRTIPLQQVAADTLGINYREIKPKINVIRKLSHSFIKKYVCIATHSTAQAKLWNNPNGWQEAIDYLHEKEYAVVSVSKEGCGNLRGVIERKNESIHNIIAIINDCEFFIGLPSGLSWLAWALDKEVIMISGMSKPWYEFRNKHYVHNNNVCNGCFCDPSIEFDRGNWNWCPRNKNFECTKKITSERVIEKIDKLKKII